VGLSDIMFCLDLEYV